ncbi:Transcriptional activator spt7 [Exophiala xenobiotica]|nr:Transcriptional activator spt7 [Exophiala xenobiotica]KAK5341004.1 Transcriptional activator spt7 [Exophiala xenobiotica]
MSLTWPPPNSQKPPDDEPLIHSLHRDTLNGLLRAPSRPHTPNSFKSRYLGTGSQSGQPAEPEPSVEEDPQVVRFRELFQETENKLATLFNDVGQVIVPQRRNIGDAPVVESTPDAADSTPVPALISKKRKLDDDDYDDYDDDDEEEETTLDAARAFPLRDKPNKVQVLADATSSPKARPILPASITPDSTKAPPKAGAAKQKAEAEDARKKLEEAKRKETETVKTLSRTMFFTLENDRDAMLDQQRLDEAERRAETEAEGHATRQNASMQQGSLSKANLGASSLTLKNLIARLDEHRSMVHASESELRALMSEVRKNRSKWASEDKIGQEELYESAEKVLTELKAHTEHSFPFLNPVKKKDAPDYYLIIKYPMDLGTMTKKLKQLAYKSKKEFVDDLTQIWKNCLRFNSSPDHIFRKHALFMQKETDKLVPLIPDIVIRDRAEVEAEERRQQIANGELDDAEESDDEPIMSSRGRKAPAKSAKKGGSTSRKAPPETTPIPETKPVMQSLSSVQRAESEIEGSQGHSTPPPGILTPVGAQGSGSVAGAGSESMDMDMPGLPSQTPIPEYEDEEYKLWKQKTKKDRAMLAAARHKLFRGDKLNAEETALLRSKAGMRRWQRIQQEAAGKDLSELGTDTFERDQRAKGHGQTLAEGMEAEEESMLPDYYDSMAAIPDLDPHLRWEQDTEGQVIERGEEYLRLLPPHQFLAPESKLAKKMESNMRQIQETRKVVSKIGVVKQMQLQSQTYQNQFQKFQPEPFVEADIPNHVMSDAGPVMAPWVCKAAFQRSIGEIFFHAGFEEFQPSALDAMTDLAADFFQRICSTLVNYREDYRIPVTASVSVGEAETAETAFRCPNTLEEAILHTLHSSGLSLNDLDIYAREDIDRTATRLTTMHDRMKAHLTDLLRPALTDDTAHGQGTFEDGGEQFVGGDFAGDLDEDFFGFRELGLDKEFGMASLTVPFHILQNRLGMINQQASTADIGEMIFKEPPRWPKINVEILDEQVGLAREWFKKRLRDNGDRPLLEDLELPPKQRPGYGRARVPASGKIGEGAVKNASPMKKVPVKNAPISKAAGGATPGDKGKRKSIVVNGTGEDTPLVNGVNPSTPGPGGDGSPEKKRPVLKAKMSTSDLKASEKDHVPGTDTADGTLEVNGVAKVDGIVDGDASMMSPESL